MTAAARRCRPRRRPQRPGLGARRAAPLARGRAQVAAPLPEGSRGGRRLGRRRGRPGACCAPRARRSTRASARSSWSACRPRRRVLRASEAAVQRFIAKPQALTPAAVDDDRARLVRAARLPGAHARRQGRLAAVAVPAVPRRAGSWPVPTACIRPTCGATTGAGASCAPMPSAAPRQRRCRRHARPIEAQLLALMRGTPSRATAAATMSDLCAGLGAGAGSAQRCADASGSWPRRSSRRRPTACCSSDVFSQARRARACWRSSAPEPRRAEVSERLAQDLLFFCAQARARRRAAGAAPGRRARRPTASAQTRRSTTTPSVLGRFDPAWIAQARKRVAAAKEVWSAVAGGEMHRLRRPGRAVRAGRRFAAAGCSRSASVRWPSAAGRGRRRPQQSDAAPPAAAGDGSRHQPAVPRGRARRRRLRPPRAAPSACSASASASTRCARAAARAARAVDGGALPARLRPPDHGQRGAGAARLAVRGREADRPVLPQPGDSASVLIPVPVQLPSMRGVLSVLGMDQASQARAAHARRGRRPGLDRGRSRQHAAETGVFDRLAGNLGALGFMIDMLSVQPQMAKSLFASTPRPATLAPVMGRRTHRLSAFGGRRAAPVEPRLIEQAQMLAFSSVRDDVPAQTCTRELEPPVARRRRRPTSRRWPPRC